MSSICVCKVGMLLLMTGMAQAQSPAIYTSEKGDVHVSLLQGSSFSVDCPDPESSGGVFCYGPNVKVDDGQCRTKVAPCTGVDVEPTEEWGCRPKAEAPCDGPDVEPDGYGKCKPTAAAPCIGPDVEPTATGQCRPTTAALNCQTGLFGTPKWIAVGGAIVLPSEVAADDSFTSIKKPVAPGQDVELYGTGFDPLYPVMNFADTGDFECRFAFADGTASQATQARVEKSDGGDFVIKCPAPATRAGENQPRSATVSMHYYDPDAGEIVEMAFIGTSAEITEVPTIVFEVAPNTGKYASGLAPPYVTGIGFDKDAGYNCVWTAQSVESVSVAEFVDSKTLRCGRPDASLATLLDNDPNLLVTVKVVYQSDGSTLINGDHPEHEFAYASGACDDGHKNGGEIGVDCGQVACGTFCEEGTVEADAGEVCDRDADCAPDGIYTGRCLESTGLCAHALTDCAQAKDLGWDDGFYPIASMRNGKTYDVYCEDGWALVARVTVSDCQAHFNTAEVNFAADAMFDKDHDRTIKFSDDDINAYQARSSNTAEHSYRMSFTPQDPTLDGHRCNPKTIYCSSDCTFSATNSIRNTDKDCYDCSRSDGGGKIGGTPNTGTRGLGHHSGDRDFFAWQRHPESNNNCGMKSDRCKSGDGVLFIR